MAKKRLEALFIILCLCLLPLTNFAIAKEETDKKGVIEAFFGSLKGVNTDKIDSIVKRYENMPVEKLNVKHLEFELRFFEEYSRTCKENWRKTQEFTGYINIFEQHDVLKGYSYALKMWEIENQRQAKLADINEREAKARRKWKDEFFKIYGKEPDPSWWEDIEEYKKFDEERSEVNSWFIKRTEEATKEAREQHKRHLEMIDRYREEIKRQCLFLTNAINRIKRLIDIATGKIPAEVKKEDKEEPQQEDKEWELRVHCDRKEIFEDELSVCNAKLILEGLHLEDVSVSAKWTPGIIDTYKGTVRGEEIKKVFALPPEGKRLEIKAEYTVITGGGEERLTGTVSILVKPKAPKEKPKITLKKTPSSINIKPGDGVTYRYEAVNIGTVILTGAALSDDKCSHVSYIRGDNNNDSNLDPGETWTFECTMPLSADTTNTATLTGTEPSGSSFSIEAKATVTVSDCPPPQVAVPYLLYMTENEAMDSLKKAGLIGMVGMKEHSTAFSAGQVMQQSPYDGECVEPNSSVLMVISLGPEPEQPVETPSANLSAELDCGDSFELAPGDFMGRRCGIVVRGWRSNTEDRVEVKVEYNKKSGIEIFPGNTSAPPSLMYTPGVVESADVASRYIFSESFKARENAPEGVTTITITVSQKGAGEVTITLNVAVLPKGQRPSSGPGIRPSTTGYIGAGGKYCVWRHHILYYPPNCFEFVLAECNSRLYKPPRWELEGSNMIWEEADSLLTRLSRFGGNAYGCEVFPQKPPDKKTTKEEKPQEGKEPKDGEEPPIQPPVQPPTEPPAERVLSRFGVHCSPSKIKVGQTSTCSASGEWSDKPGPPYVNLTGAAKWPDGSSVTGKKPGTISVTATYMGASGTAEVEVYCPEDDTYIPACDPNAQEGEKPPTDTDVGDKFQEEGPGAKTPEESGAAGGGKPQQQPTTYTGEEEEGGEPSEEEPGHPPEGPQPCYDKHGSPVPCPEESPVPEIPPPHGVGEKGHDHPPVKPDYTPKTTKPPATTTPPPSTTPSPP